MAATRCLKLTGGLPPVPPVLTRALLNNCEGVKNPLVSYCEDVFGTKAVVINFQTLF